jgi:hypothetical protein
MAVDVKKPGQGSAPGMGGIGMVKDIVGLFSGGGSPSGDQHSGGIVGGSEMSKGFGLGMGSQSSSPMGGGYVSGQGSSMMDMTPAFKRAMGRGY